MIRKTRQDAFLTALKWGMFLSLEYKLFGRKLGLNICTAWPLLHVRLYNLKAEKRVMTANF